MKLQGVGPEGFVVEGVESEDHSASRDQSRIEPARRQTARRLVEDWSAGRAAGGEQRGDSECRKDVRAPHDSTHLPPLRLGPRRTYPGLRLVGVMAAGTDRPKRVGAVRRGETAARALLPRLRVGCKVRYSMEICNIYQIAAIEGLSLRLCVQPLGSSRRESTTGRIMALLRHSGMTVDAPLPSA